VAKKSDYERISQPYFVQGRSAIGPSSRNQRRLLARSPGPGRSVRTKRTSLCIRARRRKFCCRMDDRSDARNYSSLWLCYISPGYPVYPRCWCCRADLCATMISQEFRFCRRYWRSIVCPFARNSYCPATPRPSPGSCTRWRVSLVIGICWAETLVVPAHPFCRSDRCCWRDRAAAASLERPFDRSDRYSCRGHVATSASPGRPSGRSGRCSCPGPSAAVWPERLSCRSDRYSCRVRAAESASPGHPYDRTDKRWIGARAATAATSRRWTWESSMCHHRAPPRRSPHTPRAPATADRMHSWFAWVSLDWLAAATCSSLRTRCSDAVWQPARRPRCSSPGAPDAPCNGCWTSSSSGAANKEKVPANPENRSVYHARSWDTIYDGIDTTLYISANIYIYIYIASYNKYYIKIYRQSDKCTTPRKAEIILSISYDTAENTIYNTAIIPRYNSHWIRSLMTIWMVEKINDAEIDVLDNQVCYWH